MPQDSWNWPWPTAKQRFGLSHHVWARSFMPAATQFASPGFKPRIIPPPASPALSLTRRVLCGLILSVVVLAWVIIFGATLWAVGEMVR